jgi:perosamine synthetase
MYKKIVDFIQDLYKTTDFIPLHVPRFIGNEKKYVSDAIDSTFVSSVGAYVNRFEKEFAEYTTANFAIATVNGTSALHTSLLVVGVEENTEVITQSLTFVATCNAISYIGAVPNFVDVDKDTMGLSPSILEKYLEEIVVMKNGVCFNKQTNRKISACVPMHTFGHACRIDEIVDICDKYNIPVVEDAAEALGSTYKGKALGTFGKVAAFSFNGNKIITSGGGGAIITNDAELAKKAKHLTTTAKVAHAYKYEHDMIGYNYRMPNLNAALLVAQLEQLDVFKEKKQFLVREYTEFFKNLSIEFVKEPIEGKSNYWLMALVLGNEKERDLFLEQTNEKRVMTRPIWGLMNELEMFNNCPKGNLSNSKWLEERVVNIPSSVII